MTTADNWPGDDGPSVEFLGREFLLWLWYRSEEGFGRVTGASGREFDLWVDDRLLLIGEGGGPQRFDLKGGAPASSATARTALLEGRSVGAARFGLREGEVEFHFELHADLSLRGVKLPELLENVESGEEVRERMDELEDLQSRLDDLFEAFIQHRLHESWETAAAPKIRTWLHEDTLGG